MGNTAFASLQNLTVLSSDPNATYTAVHNNGLNIQSVGAPVKTHAGHKYVPGVGWIDYVGTGLQNLDTIGVQQNCQSGALLVLDTFSGKFNVACPGGSRSMMLI